MRVNSGIVDPDGEDWILAMGNVVIWYGGEYLDISVVKHRYKATSGKKDIAHYDAYNNFELENHQFAKYQYEKNTGPTVKGHYYLSLENEPGKKAILSNGEIKPSDGKGIENLQNLMDEKTREVVVENASWGHYRIKMNPVPGEVKQPISPYTGEPLEGSDQRGLNTFYFHDSHKGYSSGCHDIESRFFDDLIEYQQQGNKRIEVLVGYPNDNWSTNGCTEY